MTLPSFPNLFTGNREFRYVFLRYQPSLSREETFTLGIVAELDLGDHSIYVLLGQRPVLDDVPELTRRVLEQLPEWLDAQVDEAMAEAEEDPLEYLASSNPYNLYFTRAETRRVRREFLEDVLRVFGAEAFGNENALLERERPGQTGRWGQSTTAPSTFFSVETPAALGSHRRDRVGA